MAKAFSGKKPQHFGNTIRVFLNYLGRHKFMLGLVGVLTAVSALANLLGTYMIKPVVNGILETGSIPGLVRGVALTAAIYAVGALSTLGYTQTMVRAAQKVLHDIRRDLFAHLQTLPLSFFDSRRNGELMSLFTNDVDTISDALNNSFALLIQSFIQVVGTLVLLFVLNWRLSLLVVVGYIAMFWFINYSTQLASSLQDAQKSGADLVFMPIYYQPASIIFSQAKAMGYAPTFFGVDGMDGILTMPGFDASLAEGLMLMTPFSATDEANQAFVDAYTAAYGTEPNQFAADAYDGVYIVKAALEAAGCTADMSNEEICDALVSAMTSLKFTGLTGTDMTWNAEGQVSKAPTAYVVKDGQYVKG